MPKITDSGKALLGRFITESRQQRGFSSQAAFADWLNAHDTNLDEDGEPITIIRENNINTLEAARYQNLVHLDVLITILDAQILRHSDGTPYSFDDAVAVLKGELHPPLKPAKSTIH